MIKITEHDFSDKIKSKGFLHQDKMSYIVGKYINIFLSKCYSSVYYSAVCHHEKKKEFFQRLTL